MLERIWENSSTVEEMYFGVITMGRTTVWIFLKKLKIGLLYNSAILILDICPKKMKTLIKKRIYIPTFIEALFTKAKI